MVVVVNNQVVASSREIARDFGCQHKHVLGRIRSMLAAEKSLEKYFVASTYNCRGRTYSTYLVKRDGFLLLSSVFRDKLPLVMKYVEAYNQTEQCIKPTMTMPELVAFSALRIIEHEQSLNNLKDCYMSLLQEITSVA